MERQFKGVWIPSEIWLNKSLTPIDKCILAEIDSFTGNGRSFFKSNLTISEELGVSVATVKRSIKKLSEINFIHVEGATRRRISAIWQGQNDPSEVQNDPNLGQYDPSGINLLAQNDPNMAQNDPNLGQNDPNLAQFAPHTNTSTNTSTNTKTNTKVVLPFEGQEFKDAWKMWIDERKEKKIKKYTTRGEQGALHLLQKESDNDVTLAIQMINNAIARGWQGIYPMKNEKRNNKKGFDNSKYSDYLDSLG